MSFCPYISKGSWRILVVYFKNDNTGFKGKKDFHFRWFQPNVMIAQKQKLSITGPGGQKWKEIKVLTLLSATLKVLENKVGLLISILAF